MAKSNKEATSEILFAESDNIFLDTIQKQSRTHIEKESNQVDDDKAGLETIAPPYSFDILTKLYELNTYHARCIQLKAALTCMMGFTLVTDDDDKKPGKDYDAIMDWIDSHPDYAGQSFTTSLYNFCIDREIFANSFFEVVRNAKGDVAEFYHLPAKDCKLQKKNKLIKLIQQIAAKKSTFDMFGRKDNLSENNEFIQLKNYSPRSRYYGVPEYISTLAAMVLDRSASEFNIRNFDNNLMISAIVSLVGGALGSEARKNLRSFLANNGKGVKNAGKVLLLELEEASKDNVELKIDKVSSDVREASFRNLKADNKEEIVAAHGVPPRLVGIMNASQLGGTSEAKEQMRMFRDITIKPRQKNLEFLFNNYILKNAFPKNKKWRLELTTFTVDDAKSDAEFYNNIMSIVDENGEKVLTAPQIAEELGYPPRKEKSKVKEKDDDEKKEGVKLIKSLLGLRTQLEKAVRS